MSDGILYDIIFFAMIAAFLVLRLRSVLGRRTGNERRDAPDALTRRRGEGEGGGKVVQLPDRSAADDGDDSSQDDSVEASLAAGLAQIREADANFEPDAFLEGVHGAFERILELYAAGDADGLGDLLSDGVHADFAAAIAEREDKGQSLETTLVSVGPIEPVEASLSRRVAQVTVRIESEQINISRDVHGDIAGGSAARAAQRVDYWTFERDTGSPDPNWLLVATRSQQ